MRKRGKQFGPKQHTNATRSVALSRDITIGIPFPVLLHPGLQPLGLHEAEYPGPGNVEVCAEPENQKNLSDQLLETRLLP